MPVSRQLLLTRALEAALGFGTDAMTDIFTEDVSGWSPNLAVNSRVELEKEFAERDDAVSNVVLAISSFDVVGNKAIAEWRLAADHTGPLVIDNDVVKPSGRRITLAGATFADFRGDKICSFRTYFDDAALVEQLLLPE
jgi:hypothetical protein